MKLRNHFTVIIVYLLVVGAAFALATIRARVQEHEQPQTAASPQASPKPIKPRFSLSTNRAYSTSEKTRIWISYQDIETLDFHVYRVKDPVRFFKQLNDPHRMGEEDHGDVAEIVTTIERKPSFLERMRSFKSSVYRTVKAYFRGQLRRESRTAFNDKFRSGEQLRLNEADYARVPLLNPDQLVGKWRQVL